MAVLKNKDLAERITLALLENQECISGTQNKFHSVETAEKFARSISAFHKELVKQLTQPE